MLCYGHDAGVWAKGIFNDDYGVTPDSYSCYVGGIDDTRCRTDWCPFEPPPERHASRAPPGQALGADARSGRDRRALFGDRPAVRAARITEGASGCSTDYEAVERDYFARTSIFPIMHTVVIRRDVYEKIRWLAQSMCKAFQEAKDQAFKQYKAGDDVQQRRDA